MSFHFSRGLFFTAELMYVHFFNEIDVYLKFTKKFLEGKEGIKFYLLQSILIY